MIDRAHAFVERRILKYETERRGRRYADGLPSDGEAIASLGEVEARLGDARVVSFDLFDTLLLRRGLAPEAVDRKVAGFARALAGPAAGEAVFSAKPWLGARLKTRMIAEDAGDEPPLVEIYRAALAGAAPSLNAAEIAEALVAFETRIEAAGICAAPGAAALLDALKARGLTVVATSDMFLHRAEIVAILAGAGLGDRFDHVFVSADFKWTKHGGRLFPLVADRLGVEPADILHIGDRIDSDVEQARAGGWRALHLMDRDEIAESKARQIAESHKSGAPLRRGRLAAALDFADPSPLGSPERIADQVIGPACGLLALRALTRARRIGAARLFHLTRDATVVGAVAAEAALRHPHLSAPGVEVKELAISRALGARLQIRSREDLWKLGRLTPYLDGDGFTGAAILRAFGLPQDALPGDAAAAEGDALRALLADDAVAARLFEAMTASRREVEDYLETTGLLSPEPSVAVDIGYSGTFAVQLSDLLFAEPRDGRRAEFLFLATSRYINGNYRRLHPSLRLHPGVALDHRRRSARWATWNFAWLEPFLVDPERGRLEGYDGEVPRFAPSPLSPDARRVHGEIRDRVRRRALRFIDDFHAAPGDLEEIAALLQRRTARFAGRPRGAEVAAVRRLAHQSGQTALETRDPTRRVSPLRLLKELEALKLGDHWVQGSLRRSGLGLLNAVMADRAEPDRRADPRAAWD
ncbi:MAG: HAD family hydrolase [Pseudomonadota bacterium]